MHVDGVDNKVADCLSCYYENDMSDDAHSGNTYVNADIWLDPDGELLPTATWNCMQQQQGGQNTLPKDNNIEAVLRTDPHRNLMQNWDIAGASEGDANVL